MDKVKIKSKSLNRAVFNLSAAGCDTVEVSVVPNALRLDGRREDIEEVFTQHVWSMDAEEIEGKVGQGEALTEEEIQLFDQGKCPKCPEHGQLFKGDKEGLAYIVTCAAGHTFWVPPKPFAPEYRGQIIEGEKVEEKKESEKPKELKEPEAKAEPEPEEEAPTGELEEPAEGPEGESEE